MDLGEVTAIREQIQGNVVEPYRLPLVRHLAVRVAYVGGARQALAALPVTTAQESWPLAATGPFVNVGVTFLGLQALGVPEPYLRTFPPEFQAGMVARAGRLGDCGTSAPEHWVEGLRTPEAVHLMVTIHAKDAPDLDGATAAVLATLRQSCRVSAQFEGEALVPTASGYSLYTDASVEERRPDAYTHARGEHFGFRDGISQPLFDGFVPDGKEPAPPSRCSPLGVVLLGHPNGTPVDVLPPAYPLGHQGSYSAFRVLGQDVAAFRRFVGEEAARLGIDAELLKAKMCGRWADGTPLAQGASAKELDDFDFSDDQDGAMCPVGSHIRRANPRNAHIVQRPSNHTRRLVRRGMPFGPWLEHGAERATHDGPRVRGLLGNFLCASLSAQFEATQFDWLNLGLQDPSITSTHDPLVGANDPEHSRFTFCADGKEWHTVRGLPRFVETMGGAYLFIPSMRALDWLASAGWTV